MNENIFSAYIASIIIPIRSTSIYEFSIRRLNRIISIIPYQFEIIIVDDGSSRRVSDMIRNLSSKHKIVKYIYLNTRYKIFSLSRARNEGARNASTNVLVFHDVDFISSSVTYNHLYMLLKEKNIGKYAENYLCVPVVFLTKKGTKHFFKSYLHNDSLLGNDLIDQRLNNLYVNTVAYGSSCIACNKKQFLDMGGFDTSFSGHGAEDFALMHKLGKIFPKEKLPVDYSLNTGSGHINEYRGFRAYFALFAKECIEQNIYLVHLFHKKRGWFKHSKHKKNFQKLKYLMDTNEY